MPATFVLHPETPLLHTLKSVERGNMSISHLVLAGEPASIFYMVTGAIGFAVAGLRRSSTAQGSSSVAMLFCRQRSRSMLKSLRLL
jgi:hypothetical protein